MNSSNPSSTKPTKTLDGGAKTAPIVDELALVQLSQGLLDALRQGGSGEHHLKTLAQLPQDQLLTGLVSEAAKMAFWINVYNAFNLHGLLQTPLTDIKSKQRHFWGKFIQIAGLRFSLNDIEHGILRRSQLWWARGYLSNPFPSSLERRLRLRVADPRIHFALNCGARGCPAIRFYDAGTIEAQLEMATMAFMLTDVDWDAQSGVVSATSLFIMYAGDFGGRRGIKKWIARYRPETAGATKLQFKPYDWTPQLDKFEI